MIATVLEWLWHYTLWLNFGCELCQTLEQTSGLPIPGFVLAQRKCSVVFPIQACPMLDKPQLVMKPQCVATIFLWNLLCHLMSRVETMTIIDYQQYLSMSIVISNVLQFTNGIDNIFADSPCCFRFRWLMLRHMRSKLKKQLAWYSKVWLGSPPAFSDSSIAGLASAKDSNL